MSRSSRWNLWAVIGAVVLAMALVTGATLPPARAAVSGGIVGCGALAAGGSRYAPGTVTVLQGRVGWRPHPGTANLDLVLPATVVEQVAVGGTYRFDLAPGSYVLESGISYVSVTLGAGDDAHVDIPNMCI